MTEYFPQSFLKPVRFTFAVSLISMRVIAIDPSLRLSGYAVVDASGKTPRALAHGEIRNPPARPLSECLHAIHTAVLALIEQHQPDVAAIEGIIFVQSVRTAITLGSARGAALLAFGQHKLPVYEYAPRRVKQAVVGRGGAAKEQVAYMVRARFGLTTTPGADAADALAIALTHWLTAQSPITHLRDGVRL